VKLRAQRFGGQWTTCRAWVEEFIVECTNRELGLPSTTPASAQRKLENRLRAQGALK
jgi:hypothetical protein